MQLDYHDYITLLNAEVERKRKTNNLPLLLVQPSPGSIRSECENVCKERYERKDEPALRAFFGPAESERQFLKLIEGFPVDKFRPLVKYLKGGTGNTEEKNIELLAWLIDFRHRPYGFKKDVLLSHEEQLLLGKKLPGAEVRSADVPGGDDHLRQGETKDEVDLKASMNQSDSNQVLSRNFLAKDHNRKKAKFLRTARILVMAFLVICTVEYFRNRTISQGIQPFPTMPERGCMYWADDHYERLPCDEKKKGVLTLPFDADKMQNFRKITDEDTITEKSIGKLYYVSINSNLEYYTSGGNHPIYHQRVLRVLSKHIYETHLKKPD